MDKKERKWLVVYTAPRSEKAVSKYLNDRGIEVYLPLQRRLKQWSDRKKWIDEVIFPSYVFVKVDPSCYYDVLNSPKVIRYIYFNGKAAEISEREIESIRKLCSGDDHLEIITERILVGERVRISGGTLAGIEGELVEYRGAKRVMIRVEQLEYSLIIEVPLNRLIRMETEKS
jgi:transcriptional antiterminator RfaH